MTSIDYLARANARLTKALDAALDAYPSKAAQKRVLDDLNRAYDAARDAYGDLYRVELFANDAKGWTAADRAAFLAECDVPFDLHLVRESHIARLRIYSVEIADLVVRLRDTREAVRETAIEPPIKTGLAIEERKIEISNSIRAEMERLGRMYDSALYVGRLFGGLNVSANVHLVTNAHGTTFVRAFYYVDGRRMPLNTILAAADTLAREKEGA